MDVLFEQERVVAEVDGVLAHSGAEALVRDLRRQNRLIPAGFVVLRFSWADLTTRPEVVVAQVRDALGRRRSLPIENS